jgi:hypothetical protein
MTQTSTRENARIYEVGFNILPTVGVENVDKVVQGIREEITRRGFLFAHLVISLLIASRNWSFSCALYGAAERPLSG